MEVARRLLSGLLIPFSVQSINFDSLCPDISQLCLVNEEYTSGSKHAVKNEPWCFLDFACVFSTGMRISRPGSVGRRGAAAGVRHALAHHQQSSPRAGLHRRPGHQRDRGHDGRGERCTRLVLCKRSEGTNPHCSVQVL